MVAVFVRLIATPGGRAGNASPCQLLGAIATWCMKPNTRYRCGMMFGLVEHQRNLPEFVNFVHEISTLGNILYGLGIFCRDSAWVRYVGLESPRVITLPVPAAVLYTGSSTVPYKQHRQHFY